VGLLENCCNHVLALLIRGNFLVMSECTRELDAGAQPFDIEARAVVHELYAVFETYRRPEREMFCAFCYEDAEIEYFCATELRSIDEEYARRLVWESADHWENSAMYKHYLPRILEALSPPSRIEDIFPEHLFDVLHAHCFHRWPENERMAVLRWVQVVSAAILRSSNKVDPEWLNAAAQFSQSVHTST
jgi:hypothetical protein